jgi:hypothetical protein
MRSVEYSSFFALLAREGCCGILRGFLLGVLLAALGVFFGVLIAGVLRFYSVAAFPAGGSLSLLLQRK